MTIQELYSIYLQHPHVQTDTRKLKQGELYFALKGPNFNGNKFAQQAIDAGAAYAIIDEKEYAGKRTILVNDVLETLQHLARHHRQQFRIPFIAITGSNGKTTTKELIHSVLSTTFKTYTTQGNLNNHIGVPLTLLSIKADAEMAVIEMGANHQREIASYCRIALPTHGLITNCGKAHLEGFGGEEGVRKGKGELYDHLRATDGTAFVFSGYDYLQTMSIGIKHIFTYGTSHAQLEGTILHTDPFLEVSFHKSVQGTAKTKLVGAYNLPNVLAAAAIGHFFSVPDHKILAALDNYTPSNSRSQLLAKGSNRIILDAYNANPTSMKAAIENFAAFEAPEKILVLGAMAELGTDSISEHQQIIREIQKNKWNDVLLVGGDFAKIDHPYRQFGNAQKAGEYLASRNLHNSALLIKGSRSMQMEKVLEFIK